MGRGKILIAQKWGWKEYYGMSGEINWKGQYIYYGKVGGCIITGNEDGVKPPVAMGFLYFLTNTLVFQSSPSRFVMDRRGRTGPSLGDKEFGKGKKLESATGW